MPPITVPFANNNPSHVSSKKDNPEDITSVAGTTALPTLIQDALAAMEVVESRKQDEEEQALLKKLRSQRPPMSKEPADTSATQKKRVSTERFESDDLYPAIHRPEMLHTEYRERTAMFSNQWYYDEYSGLYRQNISSSDLYQSLPNIQQSMKEDKKSSLQHTAFNRSVSFSVKPKKENMAISEEKERPIPKSVDDVYELRKKAQETNDYRIQLDLCRALMATTQQRHQRTTTNESPILGTPPSQCQNTELRNKSMKDLVVDDELIMEAQKMLKKLAEKYSVNNSMTDGDAQFLLANCHGVGDLGLPQDREKAFRLYLNAAKQNHTESIYRAGVCYEIGLGTTKDYDKAVSFFRKAATISHTPSMYKLAVILLNGLYGQTMNPREGVEWLQRAVALKDKNCPEPLFLLAVLQFEGFEDTNMIPDPSYALELLHEAALLGHSPSQVKLGQLYEEEGGPVEVDDALSLYWYSKAAGQNNADAALALSKWYLTGSSGILEQSDRQAYLWAREAAANPTADRWTIAKASFCVGMYVDKKIGLCPSSTEDSFVWFRRAAALGHMKAVEMMNIK
ncbi:hypothetical protein BDB01DRAFT_771508 [Pilobolus umbonatus]|nr:hypothetical protein BDB01DRAFT_771508 [Pilobolus umbonatus]